MTQTEGLQPSKLHSVLSWLVTLLAAVALVLTSVRVLLLPWFLTFEYNSPGFPADPYGFTKQERLYWSRFALDYLLNDQDISYLADLRFGDGTVVYNERELQHMVDVKIVVASAMRTWFAVLGLLVGLGIWARIGGWWNQFRSGMGRGGWLTLIMVAAVIILVLIAFGVLFVAFHNIFFDPGTWTFLWSDTLIRLFPERFWRDIFIFFGLISAGLGLLTIFLSKGFRNRPVSG